MKSPLLILLSSIFLTVSHHSYADYFSMGPVQTKNYDFSRISIPDIPGTATNDVDGNNLIYYVNHTDSSGSSSVELVIDGTLLGDGKTYATSNPGVGVQYTLHLMKTTGITPSQDITSPPFRYTLISRGENSTLNLWYRLVRISEHVPAGEITSAPTVNLVVTNLADEGEPIASYTLLSSSIQVQPKIVACGINAPTEIKLSPLYGNTITTGALNSSSAQSITLTNCPGAINGISYNFSAVYGTHKASNGVLNTVTGDGYAEGVYIQVQNADGSAHKVNGDIALSEYDGSGDYTLPDFKVAYFVDDANSVRPGNVKSAIEIKLSYN